MLDAAVPLDVAVAAMVVRQEESFIRYYLSGASSAEQDHGILQGCLVDAVDVFGSELEAVFLHVRNALGDQGWKPHPFVRKDVIEREGEENEQEQGLFHMLCVLFL